MIVVGGTSDSRNSFCGQHLYSDIYNPSIGCFYQIFSSVMFHTVLQGSR